jgi:hypothetical protein
LIGTKNGEAYTLLQWINTVTDYYLKYIPACGITKIIVSRLKKNELY